MRSLALLSLTLLFACDTKRGGGEIEDAYGAGLSTLDEDGDGFSAAEDCDDNDASRSPAATEICDSIDNDCDGEVDEGVTDRFYADADADGFGDPEVVTEACEQPSGAVQSGTDCDDSDASVFPSALEVCNGVDDNCDGAVDEGLVNTWYPDADGDGYGDPELAEERCDAPSDHVDVGGDCDDTTAAAHPGAIEICDEIDNDCDEEVDEGVTTTFWVDRDGDGYGDAGLTIEACALPEGYAASAGDCDDTDIDVSPSGTERCNGVDDDCDGTSDEDDAIDASTWHLDGDGDGVGLAATTTTACQQPSGYVAATAAFDCDDGEITTYPGADEYCDGHDDDCDGTTDEADAVDATTWWLDADGDSYGGASLSLTQCSQPSGYVASSSDCDDLAAAVNPGATEVCNDTDDDCDGSTDEGLSTSTWYADSDGDGYGDASTTTADCGQPSGYVADATDCDDGAAAINPAASEVCDSLDNDCDGDIDDDDPGLSGGSTWYLDGDGDGYGDATSTTDACLLPSGYASDATDCDDASSAVNPGASESCNGDDDDCDGDIDEGVLGTGAACAADDCAEVLDDDPSALDGSYYLDVNGTVTAYTCDMTTDGGGWTRVGASVAVWGTSYDTTYYNSEGFSWDEVLFAYVSGSVHAHCTYPTALTGCNNLGFQFASQSWGVPLNWGSSICGMSTTDYTSNTTYIGGYDFVIDDSLSSDTIRVGALEAISGCTTSDNPGTAYLDIYVRQ